MAVALSTGTRNDMMSAIKNKLDAGAGPGVLKFYTTPRPASGAAITSQTLVSSLTLSDPCGSVASGVLTFSTISPDLVVDATGAIAWCRGVDSDGSWVLDMSAGLSGSGAEVIFNTVDAVAGGTLQILSGSLTEGNP